MPYKRIFSEHSGRLAPTSPDVFFNNVVVDRIKTSLQFSQDVFKKERKMSSRNTNTLALLRQAKEHLEFLIDAVENDFSVREEFTNIEG